MRNRIAVITAALLLASAALAQAQDPPTKPALPTTPQNGLFDVGYRGTSTDGDAARYERYRDLRDGATTLFSTVKNTDTYRFSAFASNMGYHDQRYQVGYFNAKTTFNFMWDSIPTNFSYLTTTPWTDTGGGVLTLDDNAQKAVQAKTAVGVPCAPGAPPAACGNPAQAQLAKDNRSIYVGLAKPFDMQMRRDAASVDMSYAATKALGINVGFTSTAKTGQQPWAASFAFNNVNELPLPLDQRTNEITAGLEWANQKGMVRVAYDGSFFNNNIQTLTWDNPLFFTDFNNGLAPPTGPFDPSGYSNGNGPARGQMALSPNNQLNAVGITGLYKMPSHTTINGIVRFTDMTSNATLLPWSTNSSINNPAVLAAFPGLKALPRSTAEAEVKGMNAMFNFNSRPTKLLGLQARYRYNKHDNLTPHFDAEEYVRFDAVPEETGGETEQFDVTNQTFDATATLSVAAMALRVGYGYDSFDRTGRSFSNMSDNKFRMSVDTLRTQYVTLRAGYDYIQRKGSGFSQSAIEDGGAQPGLRFYDEADRNTNKASVIVILSPIDILNFSATVATGREEYKGEGHEFGLLTADVNDYTFNLDLTPNDYLDFGVTYGRSDFSSLQKSRNANPPPDPTWTDPTRDWTLDNGETVNNASAYLDVQRIGKDGNLRLGWDFSDASNAYTLGGPRTASLAAAGQFVPLPDVTNQWNRFTVDYKVFLAKNVGLGLGYWYEKFEVSDFNTIDTNGPVGFAAPTGTPRIDWLGGLMTGYGNRPYTGQTVFVRLLYRF
ncbi:MAG: MtrB/PioB family outer membrane beta-barrel protein [Vicinamibacterales bacterium]